MSAETLAMTRYGYDAWNRGDLAALRSIYASDVTASPGEMWPTAGEVSGPDAIIDEYASILATFQHCELVADDFIECGESVVVPTRWRGTLMDSESVIEEHLVAVYTYRHNRVARIAYYQDLDAALQATTEQQARSVV